MASGFDRVYATTGKVESRDKTTCMHPDCFNLAFRGEQCREDHGCSCCGDVVSEEIGDDDGLCSHCFQVFQRVVGMLSVM